MRHKCKRFGLMPLAVVLLAVVLLAMVCVPVGAEPSEWVDLGTANTSSAKGLTCYNEGDGRNAAFDQGGVNCRSNEPGSRCFYFGVDDGWAYQGSKQSVCVAIQYYDNTTNTITLQYDSVNGGSYSNAIDMPRMGTNTWKTFLWHIEDAYFGNRQSPSAAGTSPPATTACRKMCLSIITSIFASGAANMATKKRGESQ